MKTHKAKDNIDEVKRYVNKTYFTIAPFFFPKVIIGTKIFFG